MDIANIMPGFSIANQNVYIDLSGKKRYCWPRLRLKWRITMAKYQCMICGYIYDEDEGCEADGIAPGTKWQDIPEDWYCPDCGVTKSDFELME